MIAASRPSSVSDGFTLFELLVVLAILGFMVGLIVSRGPMYSRTLTAKDAAGQIAGGLREARSEAIGADHPVSLTVNLRDKTFRIADRLPQRLPPALDITLQSTSGEMRPGTDPGIRFDPDGSSTGGRIMLADGKQKLEIGVDWLTGRIKVVDGK